MIYLMDLVVWFLFGFIYFEIMIKNLLFYNSGLLVDIDNLDKM